MITDDELVAARPALVRACRSICGRKFYDDAEDLAHDTLVRAIEHRDQYEPNNLAGFLNSIARRLHKDRLRHGRSVSENESDTAMLANPSCGASAQIVEGITPSQFPPTDSMLPQEAVEALHRALSRMQQQPAKFSNALMMVSVYGPTEAGEITGENPATLKSLAKRCRDRM